MSLREWAGKGHGSPREFPSLSVEGSIRIDGASRAPLASLLLVSKMRYGPRFCFVETAGLGIGGVVNASHRMCTVLFGMRCS